MDNESLHQFKRTLEEERDKLIEELNAIAKPDPRLKGNWNAQYPQMEQDSAGVGRNRDEEEDEVEEYETRLEVEHSLESRLLAITQALRRVDEGTYGMCRKCKRLIPRERLMANPAAAYDIEHEPLRA